MQIDISFNSCIFKNKTKPQIIHLIKDIKMYYKSILIRFIKETNFPFESIDTITFKPNMTNYGYVETVDNDKDIKFNIYVDDSILPDLSLNPNSTETFMAKSVVQHEIFHCMEIKYLYDEHILHSPNPLDNNFEITTTYNFLYDEAVKLWSEIYAVYNNRKINVMHEVPDVRSDIQSVQLWLLKLAENTLKRSDKKIKLPLEALKVLHEFWYHLVSMIALHIESNDQILIDDYKNSNDIISSYFDFVYSYIKINIDAYPIWLNEENYIKFGKCLMSIISYYGLKFSTEDLSDNFMLEFHK